MGAVVLLQSTVLEVVAVRGATPDLLSILTVFLAVRRGAMSGQLAGFAGGLMEDFVSLAPLGFHALVRTALGFGSGLLHGLIRLDAVVLPFMLLLGAVVAKGLASALLAGLFAIHLDSHLLDERFWIEVAYTAVLAPILFALLARIHLLRPSKPEARA